MRPDIKLIMRHLLAQESGATEATVWIEKPLNNGLQIEARLIVGGKPKYVIVENDDEFLLYAESYKADARWNRMKIQMHAKGRVTVSTSFDAELQVDAEEKTR